MDNMQQDQGSPYPDAQAAPPPEASREQAPRTQAQPGADYGPYTTPPAAAMFDKQRKSPVVACFLSVVPGLGQVYVGYYQQGFFLAALVFAFIWALSSGDFSGMEPFLGPSLGFLWCYNIIDAGRKASLYNRAVEARQAGGMPEEFELPGTAGSLVSGTILIVVGLLLFMRTKLNMHMEWLEEWWPVLVIGVGVYMVLKARSNR